MGEDEFSQKIGRLINSNTYLEYCREIYGYREYFFNMTDKTQIDYILDSIPVSAGDIVADIGCGTGSILNLLIAKYGCRGIAIDRLNECCFAHKDNRVTYVNADIDELSGRSIRPTILISVDSLYFSKDLSGLIGRLRSTGCARMYLFYSQYLFDEKTADRSLLQCDKTKLAEALRNNGTPFRTIDFSENERQLYHNSLCALQKYAAAFEAEGNADLYEQKRQEDLLGAELYRKGLAARYLYIVEG